METRNTEENAAACHTGRRFSKLPSSSSSSDMSNRRDSESLYERGANGHSEYRGSASSTTTTLGHFDRSQYPNQTYREEDEKAVGRRRVQDCRDPEYRYARARKPRDQPERIARAPSQRGSFHEYNNYQNQAHHSSFDRFNSRTEGASFYDGRAVAASYQPHQESDIPSMIESETSSVEHTWEEDLWDRKIPAAPIIFSNRQCSEEFEDEDPYANAKMPAKLASFRLPEQKVALARSNDCSNSSMKSIEVSPGQFMRFRGADETWRAIACDFYMPCACVCCDLTLFCIQDACFVLCPDCRVVSLMEGSIASEGSFEGGVGLGFTMEDLAKWQEDLERERRVAWKISGKCVGGHHL